MRPAGRTKKKDPEIDFQGLRSRPGSHHSKPDPGKKNLFCSITKSINFNIFGKPAQEEIKDFFLKNKLVQGLDAV